jgi:hypothetical protein
VAEYEGVLEVEKSDIAELRALVAELIGEVEVLINR